MLKENLKGSISESDQEVVIVMYTSLRKLQDEKMQK